MCCRWRLCQQRPWCPSYTYMYIYLYSHTHIYRWDVLSLAVVPATAIMYLFAPLSLRFGVFVLQACHSRRVIAGTLGVLYQAL